jgi:deoxyribodipyrimidine photo-lyase
MNTILWWIRRDLRLTDNQALFQATQQAENVLPLFILDPHLMNSQYVGKKRMDFLHAGLHQLNHDLREVGSQLFLREGQSIEVLQEIHTETKFDAIYAEEDYSPYARQRDAAVEKIFTLEFFGGPTFRHPMAVRKADGSPYTVFTPYSRVWKALPFPTKKDVLAKPKKISTRSDLKSLPVPPLPPSVNDSDFIAGEVEAQRRLNAFLAGDAPGLYQYKDQRDRMDLEGTSQLSPYLRFGMLSAKQAFAAGSEMFASATTDTERQGAETWLNELIWREFFQSILFHFPFVREMSFRENLRNIQWENDPVEFESWCNGKTGYPIVDAAMRQLLETGWMHNRARMIVASFLVKDLLIDWRWGEKWFMQHLIDGDPGANNGGWQWSAGTGTDAAPYFRIFNPVLQGQKFDPQGHYVQRWVTELSDVPDKFLQKPWEMPADVQKEAMCILGKDYPSPIIDHAYARERTLERYKLAKEASELE